MVQFKTPEHQKGGKKKPKKELGAWMDIVQTIAPIAASVVGTPLAGAAVSALLEGAETKLEGGSFKDALLKGALSGGIGAATGGLAPGADKVAGEAAKVGAGEVVKAGLGEGAKKGGAFGLGLVADEAGNLVQESALKRALASAGDEVVQEGLGSAAGAAAGAVGEAGAKQKFLEHITELGNMGLGMHQQVQAEGAERARSSQIMNQELMQRIQGAMQGQYQRPRSRFYKPYGG
jgi:hypothetical protein